MTTPLKRWQVSNDEYLAAAINWLRLRLKGMVQSHDLVMHEEIDEAEKAMAEAADCHPPPALILLSQQLGLSDFERSLLLLCAAMELDTKIAELCAEAQDNRHRPYPTFALALACFDNPAWNVLFHVGFH